MPKVTIDGREIEVAPGTTILQAAMSRGEEIPHFCYHPGLSIAGNCRMCLVELEKSPKLVISCQMQCQDGMVVNTKNDRVKEAQAAVMEFLLINHPLDCPICDQAGECRLQDHAVEHGTGVSRYTEPKLALKKAVDIGEHILLDQDRCIQCSRCIRFCDEVTRTGELAFFQRGDQSQIGIYPGRRLDNPYSGNVADICPVGALTVKEFRFKTRVWYLKNTPSICGGCARGCNVMVGVGNKNTSMTFGGQLDDSIKRIVPRVNMDVNTHWICDEGRLSYQRLQAGEPLMTAQAPLGTECEWDDAVTRAADAIRTAGEAGKLGAIFSPRLTNETLFAWRELLTSYSGAKLGVHTIRRGQDDDLLIRADKGANSTGASWIVGDHSADSVIDAARSGSIDTLVVFGDSLDPQDTVDLSGVAGKVKQIVYLGGFEDRASREAGLVLPMAVWSEEDGSYVNFEGRVQWVRRAHLPRGEGRPGWLVAREVAEAIGQEPPVWKDASEAFDAMAASVGPFAGLTQERVGMLGVPGGQAATAGAGS